MSKRQAVLRQAPEKSGGGAQASAAASFIHELENTKGLQPWEALRVVTAIGDAIDNASVRHPDFGLTASEQSRRRTLGEKIMAASSAGGRFDPADLSVEESAVIGKVVSAYALAGLTEPVGPAKALPGAKLAVRGALSTLAFSGTKYLAQAMGIAPPTLYAYADKKREIKPDRSTLYAAAYFLRRLVRLIDQAADTLEGEAERTAAPASPSAVAIESNSSAGERPSNATENAPTKRVRRRTGAGHAVSPRPPRKTGK